MYEPVNNRYDFETGTYRPPSEGGSSSLLLRMTRNCPWNHCAFCGMYKHEKFELRKPEELIREINIMREIYHDIKKISIDMGLEGRVTNQSATAFIQKTPDLYFHQGVAMLLNWLAVGRRTVFLQDADSLIMKSDHMIEVLVHLKKCFPEIERITTYARSRTIVKKPLADLKSIQNSGLNRLHIGLETGDGPLLKKVRKGSTPEDHIKGGQKALEAGFQVSEYWMPGLGGRTRSKDHALNTARVLNEINPHYIRSRPYVPRTGADVPQKDIDPDYIPMTPAEQLTEIKMMLEALSVTSRVCFDHAGNYWTGEDGRLLFSHSYEGYQFPDEKKALISRVQKGIDAL